MVMSYPNAPCVIRDIMDLSYNIPQVPIMEKKLSHLSSLQSSARTVRQWQLSSCPVDISLFPFVDDILELRGKLMVARAGGGQEGPILVHCRFA